MADYNVARPFSPFLASSCCYLSAATICGRKAQIAPVLASMLRPKLLPDNVASTPPHLCFHTPHMLRVVVSPHVTCYHAVGAPGEPSGASPRRGPLLCVRITHARAPGVPGRGWTAPGRLAGPPSSATSRSAPAGAPLPACPDPPRAGPDA